MIFISHRVQKTLQIKKTINDKNNTTKQLSRFWKSFQKCIIKTNLSIYGANVYQDESKNVYK